MHFCNNKFASLRKYWLCCTPSTWHHIAICNNMCWPIVPHQCHRRHGFSTVYINYSFSVFIIFLYSISFRLHYVSHIKFHMHLSCKNAKYFELTCMQAIYFYFKIFRFVNAQRFSSWEIYAHKHLNFFCTCICFLRVKLRLINHLLLMSTHKELKIRKNGVVYVEDVIKCCKIFYNMFWVWTLQKFLVLIMIFSGVISDRVCKILFPMYSSISEELFQAKLSISNSTASLIYWFSYKKLI